VYFDTTLGNGGGVPNQKCYIDVMGGVSVATVYVRGGYTSAIVFSQPLTVTNGFTMNSSPAVLLGSDAAEPAPRGTLIISGSPPVGDQSRDSVMTWNAGVIRKLDVNVANANSALKVFGAGANDTRKQIDTSISVSGQLLWKRNDVSVPNASTTSGITINSGGRFDIQAADATWGLGAGDPTTAFVVTNNGLTVVEADGMPTLRGDFTNTSMLAVNKGLLNLTGAAVQTAGTTRLGRDAAMLDSTLRVVDNPGALYRITGGSLTGIGSIDGNLTIGNTDQFWVGTGISPGLPDVAPDQTAVPSGKITITRTLYICSSNNSIDMDSTADGKYDQVAVGQDAIINGDISFYKHPDYKPSIGTTLPLVSAGGTLSGVFAQTEYFGEQGWMVPEGGPPVGWGFRYTAKTFEWIAARAGS
jgi:hypothetical protein